MENNDVFWAPHLDERIGLADASMRHSVSSYFKGREGWIIDYASS